MSVKMDFFSKLENADMSSFIILIEGAGILAKVVVDIIPIPMERPPLTV